MAAINIEYVADDDKLQPGDLIPTITLLAAKTEDGDVVVDPDKVIDVEPQP